MIFKSSVLKRCLCKCVPFVVAMWSGVTHAAFITIDEAGMDAIYSQSSFGNTPIDIRIGGMIEHVDPTFLTLESQTKWNAVTSSHYGAANVANFWFIDDITWCGNNFIFYVGCGETPGNDFIVESAYADSLFNAELLAHELAHNLGLGHNAGSNNLMDAFLNGGTDLSASEVSRIFNSPLVQFDANGFFIEVLPVLVVAVATQVNAPSVSVLLACVLLLLWRRQGNTMRSRPMVLQMA